MVLKSDQFTWFQAVVFNNDAADTLSERYR